MPPCSRSSSSRKVEGFTFSGADGDSVHGWLLRPPGFDPAKKYPVLFLIHGGPQGAWHDEWHNRWNYQMFAAPGYAVVAINPRGSTGYGQKFTDQISQDWTGRVYDDLMKGLDHVLTKYSFLDGSRVAACGGSYGGFMVNWMAGHTDRFKALDQSCRRLRPDQQVRHDRGALVSRMGVWRSLPGKSRTIIASARPAPTPRTSRRRRSSSMVRSTSAFPTLKGWGCSPRSSAGECPAATSGFPTRDTGSPSPRTASSGGTRS